jgi:hypothetical protein
MGLIKEVKIREPELITDEEELRYINEILPLKCKISELEQRINKSIMYVSQLSSKGRDCEIYEDIKQDILKVLKGE